MEEVICNETIAVIMACSAGHEIQLFVEQDQGAPKLAGEGPAILIFFFRLFLQIKNNSITIVR